ncbi:MAG TPA: zf-HC2 domain-containing protein [Actinomycetes bacterium]|nr:zf-HC2 domain-containing protein [Actinomycetes bacterium]
MTSSPFDTGVLGGRPCPRADDRLTALADHALPPQEAERVLAHVAGCGDCRAVLDAERLTKRLLAELPAPVPDPAFIARLHDLPQTSFLAPVPLPTAGRRPQHRMAALSAVASVAAVVTLGAGWFLGGGGSSSGGNGGPAVVPASTAMVREHIATTAQFMLPDAAPLAAQVVPAGVTSR